MQRLRRHGDRVAEAVNATLIIACFVTLLAVSALAVLAVFEGDATSANLQAVLGWFVALLLAARLPDES